MAFYFSLETLLRVRRNIEHQQELNLLHAVQQVVATRNEIETVNKSISAIQETRHHQAEAPLRAAQLHFDDVRSSILREQRKVLENTLVRQEGERARRQNKFQMARRDREAVDVLRREQHDRYLREQARQEQQRIDDLFLLRREYLRR